MSGTIIKWKVNVGDDDVLTIHAENFSELERKIKQCGFDYWMVNSIIRINDFK